jgi:hypothetical protein
LLQEGVGEHFVIENLEDSHSRLVLFPSDSTHTQNWIFRNGKLVSSILYEVQNWKKIESSHFRFFISDPTMFHPANIEALESFVADMETLLGFSQAEMERLAREKITYCFCRHEEEIRSLTGYSARGMYVVSHDIVVSTFSAHFHEVAHLLMNFRLKQPHLYTHPLFLEGFAVAVGGRGGRAPDILNMLGLSILRQGWSGAAELKDADEFRRLNPSVSYPVAGVYNRFLMENLPLEDYLAHYARNGGDQAAAMSLQIPPADLPGEAAWRRYLDTAPLAGAIIPGAPDLEAVAGPVAFRPLPGGTHFGFALTDTLLFAAGKPVPGYHSFLFADHFPDGTYAGQRYFIRVSPQEAAVYDLFTNTMIALYASGFAADTATIPSCEGLFRFRVDKAVFPGIEGSE